MKNTLLVLFTLLTLPVFSQASKGLIGGTITNSTTAEPISAATIQLQTPNDRVLRVSSTDTQGVFVFDYLIAGEYKLTVSHIGFKTQTVTVNLTGAKKLSTISLIPEKYQLDEISVTPNITSITTSLGQRTINVGKDLQTTGNASKDLMNNLPSTIVDMKGNMTLRGSSNVRYFIDGHPTNLSSMELMNILPAAAIQKVELITSPSAKEYSDGLSGIVNIITSKPLKKGFNSTLSLGYGTGEKYNASIDLNYRTDKLNIWGSYTFFQNRNWLNGDVSKTDILPAESSATAGYSAQNVDGYYLGNTHQAKIGLDYRISDKTSLSYSGALRSVWRDSKMNIFSNTYTSPTADRVVSAYKSTAFTHSDMDVLTNSISFSHTFDPKNRISAALNYETDYTSAYSHFAQDFTTKPSPMMPNSVIDTTSYENNYTYLNGRFDYTNQGTNYKFELGASAYRRTMDNPYSSHSITKMPSPIPVQNAYYDSKFKFSEDVIALYFTYLRRWGNFSAKIGLRMEQSSSLVRSLDQQGAELRRYDSDTLDIYPSVNITYALDQQNSLMLAYSRRVARPDTRQLNPNAVSTNPARPNIGNPYLRPEYSDAIELTYKGQWEKFDLSTSIYYRYHTDVIQSHLTPTNPVTGTVEQGKIFNTFKNYDTSYFFGLEAIASAELSSFLSLCANINAYYVDYSTGANSLWNKSGVNTSARLSANVKLTPQLTAMVLGRYQGDQTYIQAIEQANATMDLGLRYELLKGKFNISARLTDVFDTFAARSSSLVDVSSRQDGSKIQREVNFENYETRVFYLTLSYKF